jgi:hypothetical protein
MLMSVDAAGETAQFQQPPRAGARARDGVLDALARALQLDDAEPAHLSDLTRAATPHEQPSPADR